MLTTDTRRRLALAALECWDLSMFALALLLTWKFSDLRQTVLAPIDSWLVLAWLFGSLVSWRVSFSISNLYASRRLSGTAELSDAVKAVSLGTAFTAALGALLKLDFITPQVVALFWLFSGTLVVGTRVLLRRGLALLRRHGRNLRFVLIVGTGPKAQRLAQRLEHRPDLGYRIIGYVDQDTDEKPGASGPRSPTSVALLGSVHALPQILAQNVVDEVFITLPMRSGYDSTETVIAQCAEQGISVRLPLDLFDCECNFQRIDVFEGTPILALARSRVNGSYTFVKRALDIALSAILLIVFAPLLAAIAMLIKLDSNGPVFFLQDRVGLNKRPFKLIKFRTMVDNAPGLQANVEHLNEVAGPVFKIREDPRVTRVGTLLRRTSIDELPQLINVLKGDMSLVGPRPLPLRDVKGFTDDWQRRRFSVKPGMTCLWQVSGRSTVAFEQWMQLDMAYIDSRSLALDFKILLRTIPAVLRGTGAH